MSILEVGCGTSGKYAFTPRTPYLKETVFLDIEKPERKIDNFIRADAQYLPFINSVFLRIYASHVIEHLDNFDLFLNEAWRVLKNGELHIWVPNFTMRGAIECVDHKHVFTYFSLKEILIKHGFKTTMHLRTWIVSFRFLPRILCKMIAIIVAEEVYAIGIKNNTELD